MLTIWRIGFSRSFSGTTKNDTKNQKRQSPTTVPFRTTLTRTISRSTDTPGFKSFTMFKIVCNVNYLFNVFYIGGHMESYFGKLLLLVCFSFVITMRSRDRPTQFLPTCNSRSLSLGACNSHTKPMSRRFHRPVNI